MRPSGGQAWCRAPLSVLENARRIRTSSSAPAPARVRTRRGSTRPADLRIPSTFWSHSTVLRRGGIRARRLGLVRCDTHRINTRSFRGTCSSPRIRDTVRHDLQRRLHTTRVRYLRKQLLCHVAQHRLQGRVGPPALEDARPALEAEPSRRRSGAQHHDRRMVRPLPNVRRDAAPTSRPRRTHEAIEDRGARRRRRRRTKLKSIGCEALLYGLSPVWVCPATS